MQKASSSLTETKVKDPVCGMTVDSTAARGGSYTHEGIEYFFCNPKCNERFRTSPSFYLSPGYKPGGMTASAPTLIQPTLGQPKPPALGNPMTAARNDAPHDSPTVQPPTPAAPPASAGNKR